MLHICVSATAKVKHAGEGDHRVLCEEIGDKKDTDEDVTAFEIKAPAGEWRPDYRIRELYPLGIGW